MIHSEDLFNINFYKSEPFHGSYQGMCYLVEKYEDDSDQTFLRVWTWPGPYNFASTPDDRKKNSCFEFSNDGLKEVTDYLNQTWENEYGRSAG